MTAGNGPAEDGGRETVLVTGSAGFLGAAIVALLRQRYHVVGLDLGTPTPPPGTDFVTMDVASDESVGAAMAQVRELSGGRIASVVHLAAYFDLSGEEDPRYDKVTVEGSRRLLRALRDLEVEQFIFFSTMLVHAPGRPGQPIDEEWPLDPKLPYRASKVRAEAAIREERGNIPAVMLRPAGVYDDMCHSAFLSRQIARIFEHQPVSHVYPGNPATGQPYLHLDDLTAAVEATIERRSGLPPDYAILLGEPETLTFQQLQDQIGRLLHGEDWTTLSLPKPLVEAGVRVQNDVIGEDSFIQPWMVETSDDHYELDISRARDSLGWQPRHRLADTLPAMAAALQADPAGWYKANKLNAARITDAAVVAAGPEAEAEAHPGADPEVMRAHHAEMDQMHFKMLWVHFLNMLLGLWLATSPFVFGSFSQAEFSEPVLRVTAERGLWEPALRNALLGWSDIGSGLLIMAFAALSLSRKFWWAPWGIAAVGSWLLFAPLIFWTPSAAAYANDTLIGALAIAFAILVPMMPGMSHDAMMDESDTPAGWTYSPSTYLQRIPIIALGAVGFVLARVLAAYQLGHIDGVWEPFFGGEGTENGTEQIITSEVSRAWPIADGGLGAATYMIEVLMGVMGGRARWRTMPWMVVLFGIVVVPLGVVSIYFIIIQPIVIGTYCTICLLAAAAMLLMIPFALDELVAMGQFVVQSVRRGEPFWRTFLRGGADPNAGKDDTPGFAAGLSPASLSAARGVTVPWTLLATSALGVWLMLTPLILGTTGAMADSNHLTGALVLTVAVMATAEVARPLRFVNLLFGLWLVLAPWLLAGDTLVGAIAVTVTGLVVIALTLPRGPRSDEHYGSWDRFVV